MSMRKRSDANSAQILLFPTGEIQPATESRQHEPSVRGRAQRPGKEDVISEREGELRVRVKKLHPDAVLPHYAHGPKEDAGMDLRSVERVVLIPGVAQGVATGIAIELPEYCEAQVRPRSGLGLKHSITVNFGTIDPGYRGEIRVIMFNLGLADYVVEKGDRIAQLVIAGYKPVKWEESELGESRRGAGGFGSSGR
jgi:dUTP pyrophosphatase